MMAKPLNVKRGKLPKRIRDVMADLELDNGEIEFETGGHYFAISSTIAGSSIHAGRRYSVTCKTCDVDVHLATVGPVPCAERHVAVINERAEEAAKIKEITLARLKREAGIETP